MTKLLYLEDSYLLQADATLLSTGEDEKGAYFVLDQTVFYPQGGGQATDIGVIGCDGVEVHVTFVGYVDGEVRHYGEVAALEAQVGKQVSLKVDEACRMTNAKSHTAGHLLQCAVELVESGLKAVKGFHFPQGSYVEFLGQSDLENVQLIEMANSGLADLIGKGLKSSAQMLDRTELLDVCPDLPYEVPEDKPTRVVTIDGYGAVPCGGTHLANMAELGRVVVTKVKRKKDRYRFSYSVG